VCSSIISGRGALRHNNNKYCYYYYDDDHHHDDAALSHDDDADHDCDDAALYRHDDEAERVERAQSPMTEGETRVAVAAVGERRRRDRSSSSPRSIAFISAFNPTSAGASDVASRDGPTRSHLTRRAPSLVVAVGRFKPEGSDASHSFSLPSRRRAIGSWLPPSPPPLHHGLHNSTIASSIALDSTAESGFFVAHKVSPNSMSVDGGSMTSSIG
jgi:hypothetical protein